MYYSDFCTSPSPNHRSTDAQLRISQRPATFALFSACLWLAVATVQAKIRVGFETGLLRNHRQGNRVVVAAKHDYLGGRYSKEPRFETYSYFPSLDGWNRGTGVPEKIRKLPRRAGCNFSTSSASIPQCSTQPVDWDSGWCKIPSGLACSRARTTRGSPTGSPMSARASRASRCCRSTSRSKRRKSWSAPKGFRPSGRAPAGGDGPEQRLRA